MLTRLLPLAVLFLVAPMALAADEKAEDHPVVALVKSKLEDPSKTFALIVTIEAKKGKEKELEAAFAPCLAATKKEPGCIAYELNRDPDHSSSYLMYEKFKGVAALNAHLKQPHTLKLLKAIPSLTEGELKLKVYAVPE